MPTNVNPHTYDQMIDQDVRWLEHTASPSLYRTHIIAVLKQAKIDYRESGYDKAMYSRMGAKP